MADDESSGQRLPTEVIIQTDDFLPLSVREAAKRAAVAVVECWRACETYDEWANRQPTMTFDFVTREVRSDE